MSQAQLQREFETAARPSSRFKKILVFAGGDSAAALRQADRLAAETGAAVTLCDVVEQPTAWRAALRRSNVRRLLASGADARLRTLARPFRRKGRDIRTKILSGRTAATALAREVRQGDHDLLIKTAGARGRPRPARFGVSGDLQLLRRCGRPVILARRGLAETAGMLVAAIAPPVEGQHAKNIPNSQILDTAVELAALEGLELHVLRAWRAYGEAGEYIHASRDKFWAALERFLEPYRPWIRAEQVHLLRGHPSTVIPRFAAERRIDALVMGGGSRRRIAEIFVSDTTELIVNNTQCSIVAVKPQGNSFHGDLDRGGA